MPHRHSLVRASYADAHAVLNSTSHADLITQASALTRHVHGARVTYSRNVFIPLTRLCRDVCHYCTFATTPSRLEQPFLTPEQVLEIARRGEDMGCSEALFTLGDRPEARYAAAREALQNLGHETTTGYLASMARLVREETELLPHLNPGILTLEDYAALRPLSVSMGLMLETVADLPVHRGSPDKEPAARLQAIADAGRSAVPFTTGLLIGIGETRRDRIDGLLAIRDLHERYGHIQEVIVQNFRPKPGTRLSAMPALSLEEHEWTIAAARLLLPPEMTIQAPPNLHDEKWLGRLLDAGVNDWGGVSPATPDHVNPEAPWPQIESLESATQSAGRDLTERLAIAPSFAMAPSRWLDRSIAPDVLKRIDGRGLPRTDTWTAGSGSDIPHLETGKSLSGRTPRIQAALDRARTGQCLREHEIADLFAAENGDLADVFDLADALRRDAVGDAVTYVVNRNINYTNICRYRCGFCGFSKGSTKAERGPAYRLDFHDIANRTIEARDRGATEVCLQGGIHPDYDGHTYLDVVRAVKQAVPDMHVHAFSPLEVLHGATTLGLSLPEYLSALQEAGLSSLPGTAAEVLDDEVRAIICPDKLNTREWEEVIEAAHGVGLRSTATIMFGHVDHYDHWARHLLRIRHIQERTGGFTEFVPLPFVHMEAPNARRGQTRRGPTYREALLMHAIARIVLHPLIPNIQVSWVKMGPDGAAAALRAGCNDLGGVLMDESITRSAGGVHGQYFGPEEMAAVAAAAGRKAQVRTTFYGIGAVPQEEEAA